MKKFYYIRLLVFLSLSAVFFGVAWYIESSDDAHMQNLAGIAASAQQCLVKEEHQVSSFLNTLSEKLENYASAPDSLIAQISKSVNNPSPGLIFFVYRNDSLKYWSSNSIYYPPVTGGLQPGQLVFHKNGWYELFFRDSGAYKITAMLLIKQQFAFQNKFLVNEFSSFLGIPKYIVFVASRQADASPVFNSSGQYLFSIGYAPKDKLVSDKTIPAILYFIAIILLLVFVYFLNSYLMRNWAVVGFIIVGIMVYLRMLAINFKIPPALYELALFSPTYYASSYLLNSLGDFLLSALFFTYIIIFLYQFLATIKIKDRWFDNDFWLSARVIIILLLTFLVSVLINYLFSGLILNSRISFNVNNIFSIDGFSFIGFLIIGLMLFAFYLICDSGVRFMQKTGFRIGHISILFLISQAIFLGLLIWLRETDFFKSYGVSAFILTAALMLFIRYVRQSTMRVFSFTRSLLVILGFSIYAAETITDFNIIKERESRKVLADKLVNEQDLIAEYLFRDLERNILYDKFLPPYLTSARQRLFSGSDLRDLVSKRIYQLYFTGYWGKYDLKLHYYDDAGISLGRAEDNLPKSEFDSLISKYGKLTLSEHFYYVEKETGKGSYIGKINFPDPDNKNRLAGTLIVELNAKAVQQDTGFPELLLSDEVPLNKDITEYAYAKYKRGVLVYQSGNHTYYRSSSAYNQAREGINHAFFKQAGFTHLYYKPGENLEIILSKKDEGIWVQITLFSYLFIFFCLLFLFIYLIVRAISRSWYFDPTFKTRIQVTVVSLVAVTMFIIGGGTIIYIINSYSATESQRISERVNSLMAAIETEVPDKKIFETGFGDELVYTLSKLSTTLSLDFNIYNEQGRLLFSTKPKIYEQGIISELMNRNALEELSFHKKTQFIHNELFGKLNLIAAYESITDANDRVVGYLGLPYFSRQSELKREISSFLITLINIYVLLFAAAVFITFIISNRITKPLRLIRERLGKITLGTLNEPIEWSRKDEIGALVNQYNRMVDELHNSAELLAKSERESAWREMAKQVAHEIKNPLTPMKLSIQHLQRAWKDQNGNMEEVMQRFSQTIIEQIDTLSAIANEFSNFAKMPRANNTEVDLSSVLKNIVSLYSENDPEVSGVEINFDEDPLGDMTVFADKDQLVRLFSNLLKNAVQAIPEKRNGKIVVKAMKLKENYLISISDNGSGIPSDKLDKIFTPNFTTKTGGTGLGLAMAKNIVETAGGKIWFETRVQEGTVFYVSLPAFAAAVN